MKKQRIMEPGWLPLGDEVYKAGYRAGDVVEIVVLSTGSILITPDMSGVILETTALTLPDQKELLGG